MMELHESARQQKQHFPISTSPLKLSIKETQILLTYFPEDCFIKKLIFFSVTWFIEENMTMLPELWSIVLFFLISCFIFLISTWFIYYLHLLYIFFFLFFLSLFIVFAFYLIKLQSLKNVNKCPKIIIIKNY